MGSDRAEPYKQNTEAINYRIDMCSTEGMTGRKKVMEMLNVKARDLK